MTNYNIYGKWGSVYDITNKEISNRDYVAYFLDRTQSMFIYDGLPDTIPQRDLELLLQTQGFAVWAKVNEKIYVFRAGLGGEPNPYYMPTIATIANPALNYSASLKINDECVVMSNDATYMGLLPLMSKYATLLTECDISLKLTAVNARQPYLLSASDDATKDSALKFIENLEKGKQGIIGDNDFLGETKSLPIGTVSGVITDLIELKQYYKASFFNDIGLDANYNMKRESIGTSEVQMNADALQPFVFNMLECRQKAIEKINDMFDLSISVSLNSSWKDREELTKALIVNEMEQGGIDNDDSRSNAELEQ